MDIEHNLILFIVMMLIAIPPTLEYLSLTISNQLIADRLSKDELFTDYENISYLYKYTIILYLANVLLYFPGSEILMIHGSIKYIGWTMRAIIIGYQLCISGISVVSAFVYSYRWRNDDEVFSLKRYLKVTTWKCAVFAVILFALSMTLLIIELRG